MKLPNKINLIGLMGIIIVLFLFNVQADALITNPAPGTANTASAPSSAYAPSYFSSSAASSSFTGYGAGYSSTSYQYQPSFQTYYGNDVNTYWPILNNQNGVCKSRQDFVLQVAPASCQPMVVRSDLLADQNVPVFCQIDALQVNPLIDVKEISNIQFTGNYPSTVAGVGFHPARAAINTRDKLLGSPLINNIGYAVIVLKQTQNESSLPNFVNLTLTGRLQYNAGNALGVGQVEFFLAPVADSNWGSEQVKNSFWNGRYSARLEQADENSALISIYSGDTKIATQRADVGKTTDPIYLPGGYCQFGLQLQYYGLNQAQDKARIEVSNDQGTDVFDVYKGSQFLNGQCSVSDIQVGSQTGDTGSATIVCGSNRIVLQRTPTFSAQGLAAGQVIHSTANGVEECKISATNGKVYKITRSTSQSAANSGWGALQTCDALGNNCAAAVVDQSTTADMISKLTSSLMGACDFKDVKFMKADGVTVDQDAENSFNDAITSYESVAKDYTSEKQSSAGTATYGEAALQAALALIQQAELKNYPKPETKARILNELINLYPADAQIYQSQRDALYNVDSSAGISSVNVNNKYTSIRLVDLATPNQDQKAKAYFTYGTTSRQGLTIGQDLALGNGGTMKLLSFDANQATISTNCISAGSVTNNGKNTNDNNPDKTTRTYSLRLTNSAVLCGQALVFQDTDLKKVARVVITPTAYGPQTETNITVQIGIEKRSIQLSPAKTKELILSLNQSIDKWEKISKTMVGLEKGLKAACFATAAVLTVKNFLSATDGTALARQQVMTGPNGWNKRCNDAIKSGNLMSQDGLSSRPVQYGSITQCINDNTDAIQKEIDARKNAITNTNNVVKTIEQDPAINTNGVVNQDKAIEAMRAKIQSDCSTVSLPAGVPKQGGGTFYPYTYTELRDIYMNCQIQSTDYSAAQAVKSSVDVANKQASDYQKAAASANSGGLLMKGAASPANANNVNLAGQVFAISPDKSSIGGYNLNPGAQEILMQGPNAGATSGFLIQRPRVATTTTDAQGKTVTSSDTIANAMVLGTEQNGKFAPMSVYDYREQDGQGILTPIASYSTDKSVQNFMTLNNINSFSELGQGLVGNAIRVDDRKVSYFASGPDKDLPSIVPFDVVNGWYAKVEPASINLAATGGSTSSYDASGLPKRWKICNVGTDTRIDNGDQCQEVVQGVSTNAPILGLDAKTSQDLVQKSQRALLDAAAQKGTKGKVTINGQQMNVDYTNPLENVQCQNFMDPNDCKILFNVCDPVICPPSRCDLGGTYRVANVQQTGIVGSALLCLPNVKDGVALPVCVSGIRNGIDAYVSLLKQHRDCLQQNLDNGQLVGVCDELQSIYNCQFFWGQVAPVAQLLLPKLVEGAYGQSSLKGGGEYLGVTSAWQNAQNGMDYFTQFYAQNTFQAYQTRNLADAGTQICQGFVSANVPTNVRSLLAPDSPPQFTARFDEVPYSSVTVPATSQYKVFYFINSGTDAGTYYSVYLKNPPSSGYYYTSQTVAVASGFISKGQSASETKDFTAPQGYTELCVMINNQENCGFKQVSTDFSVNYLRDQYAKGQLTQQNIQSASECTSGTPSLGAVTANLNPQAAITEAAMPNIAQRGIIRICATDNPGKSTDPTRYISVGYCDDPNTRCWLDSNSVSNAITDANLGTKNETVQQLQQIQVNQLVNQGILLDANQAAGDVSKLQDRRTALGTRIDNMILNKQDDVNLIADAQALENEISNTWFPQLVLNNQKAWIMYIRAGAKEVESKYFLSKVNPRALVVQPVQTQAMQTVQSTTSILSSLSSPYDAQSMIKVIDSNGADTGIFIDGINVKVDPRQYNTRRSPDLTDLAVANIGTTQNQLFELSANAKDILTSEDYSYLNGASISGTTIIPASGSSAPILVVNPIPIGTAPAQTAAQTTPATAADPLIAQYQFALIEIDKKAGNYNDNADYINQLVVQGLLDPTQIQKIVSANPQMSTIKVLIQQNYQTYLAAHQTS